MRGVLGLVAYVATLNVCGLIMTLGGGAMAAGAFCTGTSGRAGIKCIGLGCDCGS